MKLHALLAVVTLALCASSVAAQTVETPPSPEPAPAAAPAPAPSKFWSPDDGWLDVSGFLDEKYGFLPVVIPITEPAVGYGAAAALTFIDKPLGEARAGFGRPDITIVGGLGTQNGSWGVLIGDVRHWLGDRSRPAASGSATRSRKYGIHMGLDVAFGPDNTAVYVQVGSAWARP